MSKKILIVEDEAAIAGDLADILSMNGYEVVGIAHNYDKTVELLAAKNIDLALLDISLPGGKSGLDIAHLLNDKYQIPFIFITSFSDDETIEKVLDTKPKGYIVKPYKEEDINPIVKLALMLSKSKGQYNLPPIEEFNSKVDTAISKQEYKVLGLLWEGKKTNEIAKALFVSTNTSKTHIQHIYQKLKIKSRVQLIKKIINILELE